MDIPRGKPRADNGEEFAGKKSAARAFILLKIRTVAIVKPEKPPRACNGNCYAHVCVFHRVSLCVHGVDGKENQIPAVGFQRIAVGGQDKRRSIAEGIVLIRGNAGSVLIIGNRAD